jgi:predicted ATPase
MLHRFRTKNFCSFRAETEVSFAVNRHVPEDDRSVTGTTGQRLSKVRAVIGPNASGKTNLLKPLAFLDWFVKGSFRAKPEEAIPIEPHFCCPSDPTEIEVEFDHDGQLWRYSVTLNSKRVLAESLHVKRSRVFSYVFERAWQGEGRPYLVKQQQFGMLQREAEKARENASLLATAAQYQVPLALQFVAARVFTNVNVLGRSHLDVNQVLGATDYYAVNPELRGRMAALLRVWDLGLTDVVVEKKPVTAPTGQAQERNVPFGVHRVGDKEYRLLLLQESSGTQGAYVLLSRILPALKDGGLVVFDELEADLHPHMLTPILDLFFDPESNPHNAQMIFTCHSMEVMNLLHKAQVVLVQKDENCESEAYRLDSVRGVRADDNLYAKYMAGAYGAIPNL